MTDAPYDRHAVAYRDWWGPIIAPAALRLLDRIPPRAVAGAPVILDVGTGTGALAVATLDKWPAAQVIGVDPSSAMLEIARAAAGARTETAAEPAAEPGAEAEAEAGAQGRGPADRLRLEVGEAGRLPLPDATVDAAVSSFVIQLVPSRIGMLRELRRVLRPGGTVALVTWIVDERPFEPDDAFDRALDDLDLPDPPGNGVDPRPYASVSAAAAEFRRAGFRDVRATAEALEHRFTPERYLDLVEHWWESERFAELDAATAARLRDTALRHLRDLPVGAFAWRAPLVSVVAQR